MSYCFVEHTADIAFDAEGDSIEELFIASAFAWKESVIENDKIKLSDKKKININDLSLEELLVHFLDELNFLLLTKKWITGKIHGIKIKTEGDQFYLDAEISGENINVIRHKLKAEIKAVTFHQMKIKKLKNVYSTRIVFDI